MSDDQGGAPASDAGSSAPSTPPPSGGIVDQLNTLKGASEGQATGQTPPPPAAAPTRPDYIPEKFWDAAKGAPDLEKMAKSYTNLEGMVGKKSEEMLAKAMADAGISIAPDRPAKAEDYKLPDFSKVKMPEGYQFKPDDNHPMLKWWRESAHKAGLGQAQFEEGINLYLQDAIKSVPDIQAERVKLGQNAEARIKAVDQWAAQNLSEKAYNALVAQSTSAQVIEALEELMQRDREDLTIRDGSSGTPASGVKTLQQLQEMQKDPRYWHPAKKDENYINAVAREFEKSFPNKRKAG